MLRFFSRLHGSLFKSGSLAPRAIDVVVVLLLALAALKANWRLDSLVDINAWDETEYLTVGVEMPKAGLPDPKTEVFFAPLYSVWYLALSQIEKSPVSLVDFNFRLMAILLPCSLFGILRRAGCRLLPAVIAAFLLIINNLSLDPPTRSIHFAVLLLALAIWVALRADGLLRQACFLSLGAVAASYSRPEYGLLALCLGLTAGAICVLRRFRLTRGEWLCVSGSALVVIACVLIFGAPIFSGNNRSFAALSQGFSSNYHQANPSELNAWRDHVMIRRSVFGSSTSVMQAFLHNPKMFIWHVSHNLVGWLKGVVPAFLEHRNFLLPEGNRMRTLENAFLVTVLGGVLFVQRRAIVTHAIQITRRYPLVVAFAVGAVGVSVLGVLLTLVQGRYFFPIVFMGLCAVCLCLGRNEESAASGQDNVSPKALALGGVLLLGLTPASSLYEQRNTSMRSALAELGKLRFRDGTGYLESLGDDRMRVYLDRSLVFKSYRVKMENERFDDLLRRENLGVVHVSSFLQQDRFFIHDPVFAEFLADPAKFGFSVRPLPWHEGLYVRDASLIGADGK